MFPSGTFSFYDRMLDLVALFELYPERFDVVGDSELDRYFAAARGWSCGAIQVEPLAMKKWFNTNYHYLVPEISEKTKPKLNADRYLQQIIESSKEIETKAVLIGPLTFAALSRCTSVTTTELVELLIPLYRELLEKIYAIGVSTVQIEEPILVTENETYDTDTIQKCYNVLSTSDISIELITYFDSITDYKTVVSLPVDAVGIDFTAEESLQQLKKYGFSCDKKLIAGIVDGRNVWSCSPETVMTTLRDIESVVSREKITLSTSCSLLHLPFSVQFETFEQPFIDGISFGLEKLDELKMFAEHRSVLLKSAQEKYELFNGLESKYNPAVREYIRKTDGESRGRSDSFAVRQDVQKEKLQLPFLPTTTIGSFPQSQELRRIRRAWRKGDISSLEYQSHVEQEILHCIAVQEELDLDVLVHGEFERTDMVEFFGEKLNGFQFSEYGWVQSYGSRCVKPPLLYGDVSRLESMTVTETTLAQNATSKPVKGMLTGPITILNWSFVRDDLSWYEVAKQVAAAMSDEVLELEKNNVAIIQVDEAALREGVPLKRKSAAIYLEQAVDLFHRTVDRVNPETQIHTHMCYSEFSDIVDTIVAFDADVITVESSRDGYGLYDVLGRGRYPNQIGPGVYDIHSTTVPTEEHFQTRIENLLLQFEREQLWINPDCGLKTRGWSETKESLKNMMSAVKRIRSRR